MNDSQPLVVLLAAHGWQLLWGGMFMLLVLLLGLSTWQLVRALRD